MAKIKDAHPKSTAGGYERLVGNKEMASIFTKAQSTVISNGTELERIISKEANIITDLDIFINNCDDKKIEDGSYLCTKKVLKASSYALKGHDPDFLAFTLNKNKDLCYVIELKDGDTFDTKKSRAEKEMLEIFVNHLAPKIPFRTKYYICSFNQLDKSKIVLGFKGVFDEEEVMTGQEFCDILGINYDAILALRKEDAFENFKFVIEKMFSIKEVRFQFLENYRKHIPEKDFYEIDEETIET